MVRTILLWDRGISRTAMAMMGEGRDVVISIVMMATAKARNIGFFTITPLAASVAVRG